MNHKDFDSLFFSSFENTFLIYINVNIIKQKYVMGSFYKILEVLNDNNIDDDKLEDVIYDLIDSLLSDCNQLWLYTDWNDEEGYAVDKYIELYNLLKEIYSSLNFDENENDSIIYLYFKYFNVFEKYKEQIKNTYILGRF